jgi:AcrR family transcriptional regulator
VTRRWGGLTADERAGRRRAQLLAAGLEVFGTQGWSGTTVRDISAGAGLSQRYFYEHFAGREACFLAVLDGIAADVERIARETGGTPEARAHATLAALAHYFTADPRRARVAFVESFATPEFRARRKALLAAFAQLAARLMRALHPDPADPASLERSAYLLSGGIAEMLADDPPFPIDALVDQLTVLYRAAATAPASARGSRA